MAFVHVVALVVALAEPLLRDPEAQAAFEAAQAAFEAKDYATASTELERAFMLEPKTELLYPWAQAERNRGRCQSAIDLYEQFIDAGPPQRMIDAARQNIDRCRAELAAQSSATPEPAPQATDDETAPPRSDAGDDDGPKRAPTDAPEPDERPVGRDVVGGVLVGVGGAASIAGAALLGVASKRAKQAGDADDNDAYLDARDKATTLHRAGIGVLVTGGVLMVAGAVRYGLLARKRSRTRGDASAWWIPGGGGVSVSGRF